jgi:hypothetical protein
VHGFWLHDLDALHYAKILDEIHRAGVPRELEDVLLELQDVFFLFWKTLPRKSYYLHRLLALWRRVCDDRIEDAREGDSPGLSNR